MVCRQKPVHNSEHITEGHGCNVILYGTLHYLYRQIQKLYLVQ
jgi:hypothetical protein